MTTNENTLPLVEIEPHGDRVVIQIPNLDCLEPKDLRAIISNLGLLQRQIQEVRNYAEATANERECRLEGKMDLAMHFQRTADTVYQRMPSWAKW